MNCSFSINTFSLLYINEKILESLHGSVAGVSTLKYHHQSNSISFRAQSNRTTKQYDNPLNVNTFPLLYIDEKFLECFHGSVARISTTKYHNQSNSVTFRAQSNDTVKHCDDPLKSTLCLSYILRKFLNSFHGSVFEVSTIKYSHNQKSSFNWGTVEQQSFLINTFLLVYIGRNPGWFFRIGLSIFSLSKVNERKLSFSWGIILRKDLFASTLCLSYIWIENSWKFFTDRFSRFPLLQITKCKTSCNLGTKESVRDTMHRTFYLLFKWIQIE